MTPEPTVVMTLFFVTLGAKEPTPELSTLLVPILTSHFSTNLIIGSNFSNEAGVSFLEEKKLKFKTEQLATKISMIENKKKRATSITI
jgi:hypothetical protein